MSRRSSRLVSGGYYNSDEESDSSSVTNISYRENPVKVFKKKAGTRKAGSRSSSRANSNASSPSQETPARREALSDVPSPSPLSSQTQPITRTMPFMTVSPRPALTPSSSRSQTPTRCTSTPAETNPYAGECVSRPGLQLRPNQKEPSQSAVDSSGYSSSEGRDKKPVPEAESNRRVSSSSGALASEYMSRISTAFFSLVDYASLMAVTAYTKTMHLSALASTSVGSRTKKACGLLLIVILILLCIWFLLPLLSSFISLMRPTNTSSQTKPETQPVIPATPLTPLPPPPPPLQTNAMHHAPALDPAVVSAIVEAKVQNLLAELQKQQELLIFQMEEKSKLDVQTMQAKLEVVGSDSRLRLEKEVSVLVRRMSEYQSVVQSSSDSLNLRIQALEAQNAKLSEELLSTQMMPPPAPCPETNAEQDRLTPELQQAIEKWLTVRIQEQDALRRADKANTDCGHPMADKMADFALESQGASVISTRCSETYGCRSACVTLFGFPLWYTSESPRIVIQGHRLLLPGKCWAFHGVHGILVIALSHPVRITHVTLDHLPRYNSPTGRIDSAPKDFEVYGMRNNSEEGTLLGVFTYDENGESTQTFKLPNPSDEVYRLVEMRVLSNWGQIEYTCLYRFRVHGTMAST